MSNLAKIDFQTVQKEKIKHSYILLVTYLDHVQKSGDYYRMLGDFCSKNRESVTKKFKKFATLQNLAPKVKADIMLFFMSLCEDLKDSQKIYIYRVFNTIVIKGL